MKKLLLTTVLLLASYAFNAQVANSAEDISPLLIGEKIPSTAIETINGITTTKQLFADKNTILVVYRGGWCPYCNLQLSGLVTIEKELLDLDYQIVAVSPDALTKEGREYSSNYILAADSSTELIQNLGIAFKAPERYGNRLLEYSDGKNKGALPAPSVFIIDNKGTILFEYISPDYKNRINEKLLLTAAKALK